MKSILTLVFISLTLSLYAQERCATHIIHDIVLDQNPEFQERIDAVEHIMNDPRISSLKEQNAEIYTIPVVVHVMHLGEPLGQGSNITDARIQKGIEHLNQAFRNNAPWSGDPNLSNANIPAVDIGIEFCLASQDPQGNITNGIVRKQSQYSNLTMDEPCGSNSYAESCMKAESIWDPTKYMNIWLVNELCLNGDCNIEGYAYLSAHHGQPYDGILHEADIFGYSDIYGRLIAHEVGHYLDLYHTYYGGCSETNCLTQGDRICDTPPDNSPFFNVECWNNATFNSCTNDASITNSPFTNDVQDLYQNYMDYSWYVCQNSFTPDQKTRMRLALTNVRSSLLESNGCSAPGTLPLEWISLTVKPIDGHIQVDWQTQNEVETSHFDIERSDDNIGFQKIGTLISQNKVSQEYRFIDQDIEVNQRYYYRIKQFDTNGNFTYSTVVDTLVKTNIDIKIYPNPTRDFITITGIDNASIRSIQIINTLGESVGEHFETNINMQSYQKGVYLIIMESNEGKRYIRRITKV